MHLRTYKGFTAFIAPHSPAAASRAVDTLINSAKSLTEFPEKVDRGIGMQSSIFESYRLILVRVATSSATA